MANLESKELKNFSETLEKTLIGQDILLQKRIEESDTIFEQNLKKTKLKDDNIKKMLSEVNKSSGSYRERIEEFTKQYIKEQDKAGKINKTEQKRIKKLLTDMNDNQELQIQQDKTQYKKEARTNPLKVFSESFKTLKKTGSIKETLSTAGTGLKEAINLKNITKGFLHTAGLITDNPALNILATELSNNTDAKDEEISKTSEFIDSLDKKDSPVLTDIPKLINDEQKHNNDLKDTLETDTDGVVTFNLEKLETLADSMYMDHGALLEDIKSELVDNNKFIKDMLFMQRDAKDDGVSTEVGLFTREEATDKKDNVALDDSTMFDNLPGFDKKGMKTLKKLGPKLMKGVLGIGSVIAGSTSAVVAVSTAAGLALGDLINLATGSKTLTETINDKGFLNTLEDAKEGLLLSLGVKDLDDLNSDDLVKSLEEKKVIDANIFGDSKIKDWKAVEAMNSNSLKSLRNYDDFSDEDTAKLDKLIKEKTKKVSKNDVKVTNENETNENETKVNKLTNENKNDVKVSNNEINEINEINETKKVSKNDVKLTNENETKVNKLTNAKLTNENKNDVKVSNNEINETKKMLNNASSNKITTSDIRTKDTNTVNTQQAPIIIQQPSIQREQKTSKKVDAYNLDNNNIVTVMQLQGVRI